MSINKKIVFINFGGIGDEILFLPSVLSVKKEFPNAEITLVTEERSKSITLLTDAVNNIITADIKKGNKYLQMLRLLRKIRKGHFDIIVSSGSNRFISVFLFLTGIKQRYGYNTGLLSNILLTKAVKLNKKCYAVDMYHELVSPITGIKTNLPEFTIETQEKIPNSVLIHPGVSKISIEKGMIKTITADKWSKVIELLADEGKKVMLAGGPDDDECIKTIVKNVSPEKFENLYGTTKNLEDLAKLISAAEIFLCSDSAPLHIAVGLGVKTFAIFGSTDDKKLIPPNGNVTPIKADCNCELMPCLWEKRQTTCEKLDCLNIAPEKIVNTILNS